MVGECFLLPVQSKDWPVTDTISWSSQTFVHGFEYLKSHSLGIVKIEAASEKSIIPIEYPAIAIENLFVFCYYHGYDAVFGRHRDTCTGSAGHL